jgi:hypothetical protein
MRRLCLPAVIFLFFQVLVFTEARAQELMVTCARSTIESYSGNEKQPVLRYLDEARQVTDEFMRLFSENKFDEINKLDKNIKFWVKKDSAAETVRMTPAAVWQEYGHITRYEYRNQHLLYIFNGSIQLKGTVGTWYAVKTAKSESDHLYMSIETHKYRVEDRPRLLSFSLKEWGKDKSPEWEYYRDPKEQKTCTGMKDGLKVETR